MQSIINEVGDVRKKGDTPADILYNALLNFTTVELMPPQSPLSLEIESITFFFESMSAHKKTSYIKKPPKTRKCNLTLRYLY